MMLRTPKAIFLIGTLFVACLTTGLMVLSIMTGSADGGAMVPGGVFASACRAAGPLASCAGNTTSDKPDLAAARTAVAQRS